MDAQTPLLEKVVPPPFRQPIYHAMLDESTEAPLLEMDIGFPLRMFLMSPPVGTTLSVCRSSLDVCETRQGWAANAAGHRASRIQGKTSGKHNGCIQRSCQCRRPRIGNRYTLVEGWCCGYFACRSMLGQNPTNQELTCMTRMLP